VTRFARRLAAFGIAMSPALPLAAQDPTPSSLYAQLVGRISQQESALIAVRHDIHQYPETSGNEARTSALIAARLAALGFEVRTGVGGHGVVGILRGGRPGPVIAYRADMDAVRSAAHDPAPYRSLTPGVRHICGHDIHVAVALALAEGFAAIQSVLPGAVMLVFQPSEETASGAKAMLADGVFDAVHPDAIYAVHTAPYDVGTVATAPGGMMAGRARVVVTLRGSGDLSAAADSVRAIIRGVGTLDPATMNQPAPEGFILAQVARAAAAPDGERWTVRATITTAGFNDRARARAEILRRLAALRIPGVTIETAYDDRWIAGVTNDSLLVSRGNASLGTAFGDGTVRVAQGVPPMFSEDFGSYQEQVPGVMYFLGVSNPEAGTVGMPHTDAYVADDAAILFGARAMAAVMLERLTDAPASERQ